MANTGVLPFVRGVDFTNNDFSVSYDAIMQFPFGLIRNTSHIPLPSHVYKKSFRFQGSFNLMSMHSIKVLTPDASSVSNLS